MLADRRVKVSTIAYEMSVSEGSVIRILHDKLGMSKVSCRWIPRMLTPLQKLSRVEICRENLSLYEDNMLTYCDWGRNVGSLLGSHRKAGVNAIEAHDFAGACQISCLTVCPQGYGDSVSGLPLNSTC